MKKKVGNPTSIGCSLSAFLTGWNTFGRRLVSSNWVLNKMGKISINRTHVLSFLGKSSSAQTPKTAHAQHGPMSSIRTRHTKRKLRRQHAQLIRNYRWRNVLFSFWKEGFSHGGFYRTFLKCKIGIISSFGFFLAENWESSPRFFDWERGWLPAAI